VFLLSVISFLWRLLNGMGDVRLRGYDPEARGFSDDDKNCAMNRALKSRMDSPLLGGVRSGRSSLGAARSVAERRKLWHFLAVASWHLFCGLAPL